MRIAITFLAVLGIILSACTGNEEIDTAAINYQNITEIHDKADHEIPLESALAELNVILQVIDDQPMDVNGVRAAKKRREIATVEIIYREQLENKKPQTRVQNGTDQPNRLLYIVDFADNAGSAVLAADDRIPEPVLAITESGSILDEVFPIYKEDTGYNGNILEGFSLYNEVENDYYVGVTDLKMVDFIEDYAENCIRDADKIDNGANNNNNNNDPNTTITERRFGNWTDLVRITPKLTTVWHQRSPFNDAIPSSRWTIFHSYKQGPAGCVAIALAQIMAYHEYPSNLTVNGYLIDWKGIKDICNITNYNNSTSGTSYNRATVAQLVANIGAWCNMKYTPSFGFALPSKARDCMNTFGYSNVVRHLGYDDSEVIDMLRNDNPVFIAAISGLVGGHAWVIDGYIQQKRTIDYYNFKGNLLSSDFEIRDLMHCNFGWKKGACNGYYVSGIFKTKNGVIEVDGKTYDTGYYTEGSSNYNWAFHIITYNNPN